MGRFERRDQPDTFTTEKIKALAANYRRHERALREIRKAKDAAEVRRIVNEYREFDLSKPAKARLWLLGALLLALALGGCATATEPTPPPGPKEPQVLARATPSPVPDVLPTLPPPDPPTQPQVPAPQGGCPVEVKRGASIYRADWPGGSCVGDDGCGLTFPVGVLLSFDSTPKKADCSGPECLMPPGCAVPATSWTIMPYVQAKTKPSEPFFMQATFDAAGTYTVTASGSAGAEAKSLVVHVQ